LDVEIEKAKEKIVKEEVVEVKEEVKKIIIESLTDNQLLEFNDLSNEDIFDKEIEIK